VLVGVAVGRGVLVLVGLEVGVSVIIEASSLLAGSGAGGMLMGWMDVGVLVGGIGVGLLTDADNDAVSAWLML
jgi:hypothetical protein